jgi:hypothetical protein
MQEGGSLEVATTFAESESAISRPRDMFLYGVVATNDVAIARIID